MPGPARSRSVTEIAEAGIGIADRGGLDAVTMRAVATAVGMTAAGLYRYTGSREELLGHMVDRVSAELTHPAPSGDWRADLLAVAEQQVAAHRAHPWLAAASAMPLVMGPHVLDQLEWGLRVLAPVDAPNRAKMEAIALTNGVAALFGAAGPAVGPESFRNLDGARHPALAALLARADPGPPGPDLLRRVLTGVLDALL